VNLAREEEICSGITTFHSVGWKTKDGALVIKRAWAPSWPSLLTCLQRTRSHLPPPCRR
jgi:hypothetical protein